MKENESEEIRAGNLSSKFKWKCRNLTETLSTKPTDKRIVVVVAVSMYTLEVRKIHNVLHPGNIRIVKASKFPWTCTIIIISGKQVIESYLMIAITTSLRFCRLKSDIIGTTYKRFCEDCLSVCLGL